MATTRSKGGKEKERNDGERKGKRNDKRDVRVEARTNYFAVTLMKERERERRRPLRSKGEESTYYTTSDYSEKKGRKGKETGECENKILPLGCYLRHVALVHKVRGS